MCSAWWVSVSVGMCGPCASVAPVGRITGRFAAIASAISIWVMCAMRCSILPPSAAALAGLHSRIVDMISAI